MKSSFLLELYLRRVFNGRENIFDLVNKGRDVVGVKLGARTGVLVKLDGSSQTVELDVARTGSEMCATGIRPRREGFWRRSSDPDGSPRLRKVHHNGGLRDERPYSR